MRPQEIDEQRARFDVGGRAPAVHCQGYLGHSSFSVGLLLGRPRSVNRLTAAPPQSCSISSSPKPDASAIPPARDRRLDPCIVFHDMVLRANAADTYARRAPDDN
jgi:hypothetical protein